MSCPECPECHHVWTDEGRAKGGHNKWKGMTPAERSAEMRRIRLKGIKKNKGKAKK